MTDAGEGASPQRSVAAAAQRGITGLETPSWFRTLGIGAWLALGIAGVLALLLLLIALVAEVAIPLAIAAVLAAILVPSSTAFSVGACHGGSEPRSYSSSRCRSSWPRPPSW